eukprot:TRINITY_DN36480_c0_g1_i1.p1 TRINITY_DN36480_c0_g1~~TRINITY_DN36480_c0_g1_i1.p1  ORF type:complete len:438 (+),score=42.05 TRINITY_DN36480_c0_g1_i1:160-1314(+)
MPVDDADVGKLNSKGQLAYALGKLLGGAGVDVLGGRNSLLAVLALLCTSFIQMAKASGPSARLTSAFAVGRFGTAVVWTAAAVTIRSFFKDRNVQFALSIGQVGMRIGATFGSVIGGILLSRLKSWRKLLLSYSLIAASTALLVANGPKDGSAESEHAVASTKDSAERRRAVSIPRALRLAASTPKAWLLVLSTTLITPTFDLATLLPQFCNDAYSMDEVSIGSIAGAFPLAAPPAILAGSMVLTKLNLGKARTGFLFSAQSLSALALLLVSRKPSRALLAPALAAVSAGCAPTLSCVPPDWLMKWGGPHAGLFAGLQDVPGNLITTMIYAQVPRLIKRGGWALVFRLYALQVALGACCMAAFQALEASSPTSHSPFYLDDGGL